MIPLPSLLVLDSRPRLPGDVISCNEDIDDKHKDGNTISHRVRRKHERRRQMNEKITPPSPLRIQRIHKVKPPRFHDIFNGHQAPFWERLQLEEEEERSPRKQTVVSIRRQSQLFAFCVTLATFVAVDTYMLLPTGTVLYAVALSIAWESWEEEEKENRKYLEKIRKYRQQMEQIEHEVQKAKFEYHVLRNQPHVEIMALRKHDPSKSDDDLDFDPDNDEWIVYADDKRRRPPPPPPRLWRSNSNTNKRP